MVNLPNPRGKIKQALINYGPQNTGQMVSALSLSLCCNLFSTTAVSHCCDLYFLVGSFNLILFSPAYFNLSRSLL